jgi:hypothetical protein
MIFGEKFKEYEKGDDITPFDGILQKFGRIRIRYE